MNPRLPLLLLAGALALGARAQPASPARAEPNVKQIVIEDDGARISELRVRGVTKRIVVTPKHGGKRAYEIIPDDASRDLPQGPAGRRGAAGQRVWNVLDF
jgi:hypothetical protein